MKQNNPLFSVSWDVTRVVVVAFSPESWCLQRLFTSFQEVQRLLWLVSRSNHIHFIDEGT